MIKRTMNQLKTFEPWGQATLLLAFRLVYGFQFAQTGWGKFMNFDRTTGFFESLGMPMPSVMVVLAAGTELLGGVLVFLGLGTRLASAALSFVMVVAYLSAHAEEGFSSFSKFTEQAPFPFLVAMLVLLAFGAGRFSLDHWIQKRKTTLVS